MHAKNKRWGAGYIAERGRSRISWLVIGAGRKTKTETAHSDIWQEKKGTAEKKGHSLMKETNIK